MNNYIYILVDPRDNSIRYVGITNNPYKRYKTHCRDFRQNTPKTAWLKKLDKLNLKPFMVLIDECETSEAETKEMYWIAFYKRLGCRLTNSTNGGEGVSGLTNKSKEVMIAKLKGRKLSTAHKNNISKGLKGNPKVINAQLGKKMSEESKRKMSEHRKGIPKSLEHRHKISEGQKGRENYKGEANHKHILTEKDVKSIRFLIELGIKYKYIAQLYHVNTRTISAIKTKTIWKWLD